MRTNYPLTLQKSLFYERHPQREVAFLLCFPPLRTLRQTPGRGEKIGSGGETKR
jgi:hypothetical protein